MVDCIDYNASSARNSLHKYHDGKFVDFFPVGVQALVGFGIVLINCGFGSEESLLPGFNVGELSAILHLGVEQGALKHSRHEIFMKKRTKMSLP